jgi:hypothetical protein
MTCVLDVAGERVIPDALEPAYDRPIASHDHREQMFVMRGRLTKPAMLQQLLEAQQPQFGTMT